MDKKYLNINPFEGDFGDSNFQEVEVCVVDVPRCHLCRKRLLTGEIVKKVDINMDWDFEEINEIEIFYWHARCWRSLAPKDL